MQQIYIYLYISTTLATIHFNFCSNADIQTLTITVVNIILVNSEKNLSLLQSVADEWCNNSLAQIIHVPFTILLNADVQRLTIPVTKMSPFKKFCQMRMKRHFAATMWPQYMIMHEILLVFLLQQCFWQQTILKLDCLRSYFFPIFIKMLHIF